MDDKTILAGLGRREEEAFYKLFDKYGRYVAAIVVRTGGQALSKQDMEELCSDVFFNIWQRAGTLTLINDSLKTIIGIMARNRTLNRLRTQNRLNEACLEEEMLTFPSAEEVSMGRQEAEALWEAVRALPKEDRELFVRRYFYLERVRDLAAEKDMNETTVSSRLHRIRQKLQTVITGGGSEG